MVSARMSFCTLSEKIGVSARLYRSIEYSVPGGVAFYGDR
jgi:hypothetical protein